jgi:non-heme Fe2+,alpha-ketoglutarate-dependent halogenase
MEGIRSNSLTTAQVDRYREEGYLSPNNALSQEEVGKYQDWLTRIENGQPLAKAYRQKSHLLFPAMAELVRHPRILDAVESILGPDLLCWTTTFFIKEARDSGFVSWHQDATYWGLSEPEVVTAWVALTPSHHENGCVKVVPGTHKKQVAHLDTHHSNNLLTRGQEVAVTVDENQAVEMPLEPGQFSLHHTLLFHSSEPNPSPLRRIGLAIRYIPTRIKQTAGIRDGATLVRGVDSFGHFDHEQAPVSDLDNDAVRHHAEMRGRINQILHRQSQDAKA